MSRMLGRRLARVEQRTQLGETLFVIAERSDDDIDALMTEQGIEPGPHDKVCVVATGVPKKRNR